MFTQMTEEESAIYYSVKDHTINSMSGVVSLIHCVKYVVHDQIPGALIECGVYRGGNIEVMIKTLQLLGCNNRDIYAFDTFEGMPEPQEIDYEFGEGPAHEMWEKHRDGDSVTGSNWVRASLDEVWERVRDLGYPTIRLHLVKGMVEETLPSYAPEKIAVARLDTDFYSSTKHEFEQLYPRVSPGGIVIIDDYGAFLGSKTATDEYMAERGLNISLTAVDDHIRLFVKP